VAVGTVGDLVGARVLDSYLLVLAGRGENTAVAPPAQRLYHIAALRTR